jgi:hypothetical protein
MWRYPGIGAITLAAFFLCGLCDLHAQASRFLTPKVSPAGASAFSVALGDFHRTCPRAGCAGEGMLDVAVGNAIFGFEEPRDTPTGVRIMRGKGDGTFQPATTFLPAENPVALLAADLDQDGKLDLIVVNNNLGLGINHDGNTTIFYGKGDGTFRQGQTLTTGTEPVFAVVGDFNGDRHPDIAIVDEGNFTTDSGNVSLVFNNGHGGFLSPVSYNVGPGPLKAAAVDFDHDGNLDLAVATQNGIAVLFGTSGGAFEIPALLIDSGGAFSQGIATGDFNHDGNADLVSLPGISSGPAVIRVLLGDGHRGFLPSNDYTLPGPQAVATTDLNGDGYTDIVVQDAYALSVLLSKGNGSFTVRSYISGFMPGGSLPAFGDTNGDGSPDVVAGDIAPQESNGGQRDNSLQVLLNNGNGTLESGFSFGVDIGNSFDLRATIIATSDFNADGKPDIAAVLVGNGQVGILLANGDGTYRPPISFPAGPAPSAIAVGDFNKDGYVDLVVTNSNPNYVVSNKISILSGEPGGIFGAPIPITVGNGPSSVVVADFNNDGDLDIAVTNLDDNTVTILFGNGDFTFRMANAVSVGLGPLFLIDGTFHHTKGNDRHTKGNDIVTANCGVNDVNQCTQGNGNLSVLLGNGTGNIQPFRNIDFNGSPTSLTAGDFNRDGNMDLAVSSSGFGPTDPGAVTILLGIGDGNFRTAARYPLLAAPIGLTTADLNGDGKLDLACRTSEDDRIPGSRAALAVLFGNGDGTFNQPALFNGGVTLGIATTSIVLDANGDGAPDLVVSEFGFVNVLLNTGGTVVSTASSANSSLLGTPIKLTAVVKASVKSTVGRPSGTISFVDRSAFPAATLGKVQLLKGNASLAVSSLTTGIHIIEAVYSGDKNFNAHAGPAVTIEVRTANHRGHGGGGDHGGSGGSSCSLPQQGKNGRAVAPQEHRALKSAGEGTLQTPTSAGDSSTMMLWNQRSKRDFEFHKPRLNSVPSLVPNLGMLVQAGQSIAKSKGVLGFDGLNHADSRVADKGNQASTEPSDMALAVNDTQILQVVNAAMAVYQKTGKLLAGPVALNAFFGLAPAEIHGTNTIFGPFVTDARVVFDDDTKHWFVIALKVDADPANGDFVNHAELLIAVSNSADATAGFRHYALDITDPGFANCPCVGDQPLVGLNRDGLYITTDQYSFSDFSFQAVLMLAVDKYALARGLALTSPSFHLLQQTEPGFAVQPAMMLQAEPLAHANNGTEFFMNSLDFDGAGDNRLVLWALTNTASLRTNTPALGLQSVTVGTETYATPSPVAQKAGPTPLRDAISTAGGRNALELLDTNDDRLQQLWLAGGRLYAALTTAVLGSQQPRTGVAWFVLEPKADPCSLLARVKKQGYVAAAGASVMFPAVAVNRSGNGILAFSLAGPNHYPSAAYVSVNGANVDSQPQSAASGVAPEDGFSGYSGTDGSGQVFIGDGIARWGDYSSATVSKNGEIWFAVEYIPNRPRTPLANWGTFIAEKPAFR